MTVPVTPYSAASSLDQIVEDCPRLRMRGIDGTDVFERQVLVGHVLAPASAREQLEDYAIFLDLALYDPRKNRWSPCLFSEGAADTLAELGADRQLPFSFEAAPSVGHLLTLEALAEGRPAPELARREWVTAAHLEALTRAVARGLIQAPWLRRSVAGRTK